MIEFFPVARLRNLGKQVEVKRFKTMANDLNSVERIISSVFYRLLLDDKCPAIFIKIPKKNDEPISSLKYMKDLSVEQIIKLSENMITKSESTVSLVYLRVSDNIILCMKESFKLGDWSSCGYEYSGADGISIPGD